MIDIDGPPRAMFVYGGVAHIYKTVKFAAANGDGRSAADEVMTRAIRYLRQLREELELFARGTPDEPAIVWRKRMTWEDGDEQVSVVLRLQTIPFMPDELWPKP